MPSVCSSNWDTPASHSLLRGVTLCSTERPNPLPRWINSDVPMIHSELLWIIFFPSTTRPNVNETWLHALSGKRNWFFKHKGSWAHRPCSLDFVIIWKKNSKHELLHMIFRMVLHCKSISFWTVAHERMKPLFKEWVLRIQIVQSYH